MINTGTFSAPTDLLKKYKALGLSDSELINILALAAMGGDWDRAAELRGYASAKTMKAAMARLMKEGLMTETSIAPLIERATSRTLGGVFTPAKPKRERKQLEIWDEIRSKVYGEKGAWRNFCFSLYKEGYTPEQVLECVNKLYAHKNQKGGIAYLVNISEVRGNIGLTESGSLSSDDVWRLLQ